MGRRSRRFRVTGRPDPGRAVELEIEHYLVEQTEKLVAAGMSEAEARREAERRFGDVAAYRRRLVATDRRAGAMRRIGAWWETLRSGATQAVRDIRRTPGFAAAIVLTLGLGIGVNAAMFGVVDRILLQPPSGVSQPDQVRRILRDGEWLGRHMVTPALTFSDVEDLRTVPQFAAVGGFTSNHPVTMGSGVNAMQVQAVLVTHDFFVTLGARPRLGRFFSAEDDALDAVLTVVLSEEFWERAFGADPGILGRSVEIGGETHAVIGVARRGFTGADLAPVDVWLPAVPSRYLMDRSDRFMTSRGYWWLRAVVRVTDEAAVLAAEEQATALNVNARSDAVEAGHYDGQTRVLTAPLIAARGPEASDTSRVALWLAGVALAVLLIACANVANLFLARATRRKREVAVRLSLGATRSQILGEGAFEAVLLAGLGGVAATALAAWGGRLMRSVLLPDVLWQPSGLDGRMLAATAALSVGAGLLAGLGPAVRSSRADPGRDLLEGGRWSSLRRSGMRRVLTVVQSGLSVVLLVGAGLFIRSLRQAGTLELGLSTDQLILANLEFGSADLDTTEQNRLYEEAMERVRTVPGVAGVAATDVPFQSLSVVELALPGADSLPLPPGVPPVYFSVTPGFFETVGLSILRGRPIRDTDHAGAPHIAVVSESFARAVWPAADPLGQCFYFNEETDCTTVVGVAEDASTGELTEPPGTAYYLPLAQTGFPAEGIYIRAADDTHGVAMAVAPVLRSFSPAVRFAQVQTLTDILAPQTRSWTLGASLFTAFGLLALLVTAVGLYSLLAFDVAQRTRDIGIRSALGARTLQLLREVVGQGAVLALAGALLGFVACVLTAPFVQPLLFHVNGRDPLVLATVAAVILAVACIASLPPGLRASGVDPMEALRTE